MSRTIAVEIVGDASSVNRSFASASRSAKVFEKDLGRSTRGALAGTGVFRSLGRSLAFASGSFLAISGVSAAITDSIKGAENLAKAQKGLAVAVEHTGGNLGKLIPKYTAVAKGAADFGENQADATTALARATVLTGSAAKAQRAYQEALEISKATGKDFNSVLTATAKGQEGITTSLQRYGIQIAKGTAGTKQFVIVQSRFAGQAKANTDAADRFRAILANTEETIGTGLLPSVDKYLTELGDWLEKMEKSGKLQRDVNTVIHDGASVFHAIEGAIQGVDKVTGSFVHTLELLGAIKLASLVTGWVGSLGRLAAEWGVVTKAAEGATAAETVAAGDAGAAGRKRIPFLPVVPRAGAGGVAARVGQYTGAGAAGAAAGAADAGALRLTGAAAIGAALFGASPDTLETHTVFVMRNGKLWAKTTWNNHVHWTLIRSIPGPPVITPGLRDLGRGGNLAPSFLPTLPGTTRGSRGGASTGQPFGGAQPIAPFKSFALTLPEQLTQARADLTKSTADDVKAAKQVIARIKRLMDEGKLSGKSLLQALQAEATAVNTLQSAQAAAAQKAAAAAQAHFQNLLDPLKLEVQLSRDQAFGKSTVPALRALLASAKKALASAKSLAEEKAALDQITQLNQALKAAQSTALVTFTAPLKLQLALAKDAALGKDSTKDLLKLKAAILKFIRTHQKNTRALIDAYGQLQSVNDQLGASASSALGNFKQINTAAIARKVPGLTAAQKKALRAALSQVGPGGTVPGDGVGAYGQLIGSSGRAKKAKPPKIGKPPASAVGGGSGGGGVVIHDNQPITIYLDGKVIARSTTKHQQKRGRRNPTQRRGPNAGG